MVEKDQKHGMNGRRRRKEKFREEDEDGEKRAIERGKLRLKQSIASEQRGHSGGGTDGLRVGLEREPGMKRWEREREKQF